VFSSREVPIVIVHPEINLLLTDQKAVKHQPVAREEFVNECRKEGVGAPLYSLPLNLDRRKVLPAQLVDDGSEVATPFVRHPQGAEPN
jgi:hypothetical protein